VKALPLLGDAPIFICNIDAIWMENKSALKGLLQNWSPHKMDDLLLLAPNGATLGYYGSGDFERADTGHISRRQGESAPYVYAGVQIAKLGPLTHFKAEPFSRNRSCALLRQASSSVSAMIYPARLSFCRRAAPCARLVKLLLSTP